MKITREFITAVAMALKPGQKSVGGILRFSAVILFQAALLVGFGPPALGQTDYDKRIEALEKALQEIKDDLRTGGDVRARVEALDRELENLKKEIALGTVNAPEAKKPASTQQASAANGEQLPAPGVQGAPNPMQDDKRFLTGQDLLDESFPNSIPVPGSDVRFRIGGYAKLDFIEDLDYVGDRYEFELATIPVKGTPAAELGGLTTVHAKESRINFDFRSKAERGGKAYPLQAFLELDFFDDREEFAKQPRLRHAYGVIGNFLAGQTWTTSGDLEAIPGTIDFSGGDALYGDRVGQIRWQDRAGEHVTWALAVEGPRSDIGNPYGLPGESRQQLPNLAGRMRFTSKRGSHLQVGGDLFQLNWQGGGAGPSDTATGFGLNLTGRWLLGGSANNTVMGGGTIGRGSAHRVIVLEGAGNDAVITRDGLDVISHWQAYIGYSHYWTRSLNSTFSTAWAGLDNSEFQPGTAIHRGGSMHLNLIWFPYRLASTGFEIMWGERRNKDGAKGEAWRLQYMVKYKFN